MSDSARNTVNPLRNITDGKNKINPEKAVLNLSIGMLFYHNFIIFHYNIVTKPLGDPTTFGNLKTHSFVTQTLSNNANSYKYNGYPPSVVCPTLIMMIAVLIDV